jgi:phosphoglucosamine mutase
VAEAIAARHCALGGEQSGHVILSDFLFTGDGIVTALSVLRVMADTGRSLGELTSGYTRFPQVLLNLRVTRKTPVDEVPAIAGAMREVEGMLAGEGRLLVRYSGTEPLLRVMIEGRDQAQIHAWAERIVDAARAELA